MTRDDEIKLKVATIIDEAVGEKEKPPRRLLVWAGSACAAMLIASVAFALYLNNSPSELPADAPQGKTTNPPPGSKTDRGNRPPGMSYLWMSRIYSK